MGSLELPHPRHLPGHPQHRGGRPAGRPGHRPRRQPWPHPRRRPHRSAPASGSPRARVRCPGRRRCRAGRPVPRRRRRSPRGWPGHRPTRPEGAGGRGGFGGFSDVGVGFSTGKQVVSGGRPAARLLARRAAAAPARSRCCWAPSCRSRSIRRRVLSAAATIRARDAVSSRCASALPIAVATSSVKPANRASVSDGNGSLRVDDTSMTPQTRPSTLIGTPAVARTPIARTASPAVPDAVEKSSIRAGRPVSCAGEPPVSCRLLPVQKLAAEQAPRPRGRDTRASPGRPRPQTRHSCPALPKPVQA